MVINKLKYSILFPSIMFHLGLKRWVEIGNSGVFRPEMLLPMGLPSDVSVIAWGLSLER
jgi:phenylalanyl-tRNA synthetase alpha chain